MQSYKNIIRPVLFSLAIATPLPLLADNCGDLPESPVIVDGEAVTMEELVTNSQSVKSFIAEADVYLDCNETFAKSDDFKKLKPDDQKRVLEINSKLLEERNNIGDRFNEQVTVFKAAHPQ